jgi:hypothetical protein
MKTWTIFWLTGNREQVHGATISEAFTRQGYSAGALGAVDFYCEGLGDDWHVLVNAEGKHDWVSDQTLEQFPEHYTCVDALPPQMSSDKYVADHYYVEEVLKV